MYRHLPNQLTVLRLVLAGVFFLTLNFYRYPYEGRAAIPAAIVLFVLAALTDWLDGFLARRWKAESTFGRIMDPFCDKVLILGAFIYLSGPRFVDPHAVERQEFFTMISGVYPWMVALMLARELLVTNVRDEMEAQGVKFGASIFGKVKMVLQAVGIPIILLIVWLGPHDAGREWLATVRDVLVYSTVVATVLSGAPYIISAARALRGGSPSGPG
ncbi:MAG: CDP-diacylglycerol--glycerol-3-phosphate 3-phosphatidyltransferase [Planctomycetota bacterium]|nr:CDP-diacylglycerol--glycerol-3-phosphate 3-phosphatidyltransferase [Planctomycetota bacterium]